MSEQDFWELTPRAFEALLERVAEAERLADARAAIAVGHLLRPHMRTGAQLRPWDLYPSLRQAEPTDDTDPEVIAARIRAAGMAHG